MVKITRYYKDERTPEQWIDATWLDIPIPEAIKAIIQKEIPQDEQKIEYYQRYHQSVKLLIEILNQLLEINRATNILSSDNGKEELRVLFRAGTHFNNGDFLRAMDTINTIIEKRIRTVFHLAFSLHHGQKYFKHLPTDAQDRISNLDRSGYFK